jgi:RNA polymerase sigma-70 factor (ECF subfamily)
VDSIVDVSTKEQVIADRVWLCELVAAVASGDSGAFARLHGATSSAVVATIRRSLRDPWQSEEVAQEVFLEVWQKAGSYDPVRASVQAWILTMATRRAIDRVRAAQAARDRDARSARRNTERPHDEVWESVESRIAGQELREALSRLSPLQREALTTTYLHGRSVAEAARRLGASETALRTRMRDGLLGLRRMIEPGAIAA